jgi:hypothetical protein
MCSGNSWSPHAGREESSSRLELTVDRSAKQPLWGRLPAFGGSDFTNQTGHFNQRVFCKKQLTVLKKKI